MRVVPRIVLVKIRVRHDEFFEDRYRREKKLNMNEARYLSGGKGFLSQEKERLCLSVTA